MTEIQKAPLIYQAITAIMAEIPSIAKDKKNTQQGYSFRGIDDVYAAVNPILAKHGVFMRAEVLDVKREERPSKSGGTIAFVQAKVRYFFVASDGSFVATESIGEGMDSGDKASPKAMSIAQKYAILQMFAIPTADPKDVENDDPEPAQKPRPATAPPKASPDSITDEQRDEINRLVIGLVDHGENPVALEARMQKFLKAKFHITKDVAIPGDLTAEQAVALAGKLNKAVSEAK